MNLTLNNISRIIESQYFGNKNIEVSKIIIDSRIVGKTSTDLFFAIVGEQNNGHKFIKDLYEKGVRGFVVSQNIDYYEYPEAGFLKVENTVVALQKFMAYYRKLFDIPIIAITGSNGKTIVKEWLNWILSKDFNVTRSPKSYNSQVGVPLSISLLDKKSEIGIFEAGISKPDEMKNLEEIIKPNIGVFTNAGTAHQANFNDIEQKIKEKSILFNDCDTVVYNADEKYLSKLLKNSKKINQHITWSNKSEATIKIINIEKLEKTTIITVLYNNTNICFTIPFSDKGSIQNAVSCFCTVIALKIELSQEILQRFATLPSVKMRLEMISGIHNSTIINDSYNSDTNSLEIALDYLNQKKSNKQTLLILSDIPQSSENKKDLYKKVNDLIIEKNVNNFIGIGEELSNFKGIFSDRFAFYKNTDDFLDNFCFSSFYDTIVLLKGARDFKFEKISKLLQAKSHETVIEIDLNLIKNNFNYFKSCISPNTKVMAMVKAFSYGSGYVEIANFLQHNRIDYLTVAFVDEGIELREGGITMPIMVMNPNLYSTKSIIDNKLEPEIYSLNLLQEFIKELEFNNIKHFPVHLKIDTGMHRLGFSEQDIEHLINIINNTNSIKIESIFSHLAGTDNHNLDYFTEQQVHKFLKIYDKIVEKTGYKPMRHVLNSWGIVRFPQYDFEMVRLGIGLYGLIPELNAQISQVSSFKSVISQTHSVKSGESVSYNRSGKVNKDSIIATVPVGYADGLNRKLGNGNWYFYVNNQKAYTVGNICMDMCMIDITDIEAKEGDTVIVFGHENSICKMAKILETIPYEIITGISQRVKRIYFEE